MGWLDTAKNDDDDDATSDDEMSSVLLVGRSLCTHIHVIIGTTRKGVAWQKRSQNWTCGTIKPTLTDNREKTT
jgi:hypothetical protein